MIIKSGRYEYELTEKDRILFNGAVYILLTQKVLLNSGYSNPMLTKSRVEKLIKEGKLILAEEKYKALSYEYDLYKIAEKDVLDEDNN